jgi:hypothetical protein
VSVALASIDVACVIAKVTGPANGPGMDWSLFQITRNR